MKQHIKAAIIVVILGVVGVWAFQQYMASTMHTPSGSVQSLAQMEKEGVPNFTFKDFSGNSSELSALKGKVVILNFWASWCSPCVEEVPSLIKLVKEFKGDVKLVAISGDSRKEDIEVFLKSFPELQHADIQIVWDEDRSLMKRFEVSRLPESLVLGKDQKVVKKLVGSIDWYNKDSIEYMKTLLAK
ncbi:TlpA family protein disulfide reductase [Bdellovibrio sp. HCB2-146]|uniref:TlpA family protein disulfide reductase n=1 Tax=Bdellovibrio sp. HCB2-146 TaxID=3394362 RepID=UPI0039BCB3E7